MVLGEEGGAHVPVDRDVALAAPLYFIILIIT